MSKKELVKDIKRHCKGKCESCISCVVEVKTSRPSKIKYYDSLTQCRLYAGMNL